MRAVLITLLLCALVSCQGYQLGGNVPQQLRHVSTVSVPLFENDSLEIRASSLATNATVDAITRDGTYRITSSDQADTTLKARITKVEYGRFRSERFDTLRAAELAMKVHVSWQLIDNATQQVLMSGHDFGRTIFFVEDNQQTSRSNALPLAMENVSKKIVSRIADGF